MGPTVLISALGDSLCGGYYTEEGGYVNDPNASFPIAVASAFGAQAAVASIAGAASGHVHAALDQILGLISPETSILIVTTGTNDVFRAAKGVTPIEENLAAFDALLARCRAHMPQARIVIVGVRDLTGPPNKIWKEAERFRALVHDVNAHMLAQPGIVPVDVERRPGYDSADAFPDAVHPSPAGVRWYADAVLEALQR